MKKLLLVVLSFFILFLAHAQHQKIDSLKRALNSATTDSARFIGAERLSVTYAENQWETALKYTDLMATIAHRNNHHYDQAHSLDGKAYFLQNSNRFSESLVNSQKALQFAEIDYPDEVIWTHTTRLKILASIHHDLGHLMGATNNVIQQIPEYKKARALAQQAKDTLLLGFVHMNLGDVYTKTERLDLALKEENDAEKIFIAKNEKTYIPFIYGTIGQILIKKNKASLARAYYYKGAHIGIENQNLFHAALCYRGLTEWYLSVKEKDSALVCAVKSFSLIKNVNSGGSQTEAGIIENLSQAYWLNNQPDSSYKYARLAYSLRKSIDEKIFNNLTEFEKLSFKTQQQLQQLEQEKVNAQNRTRTWGLISVLIIAMLLAATFYQNNLIRKKANRVLKDQKEEVEATLGQLKTTQTQLIQSEKMASLGELTAGIDHEIQNPLNFVNNFSEGNKEMLEELKAESRKPKAERDEQLEKDIINDLIENEQKINHHGKRADAIVKGMLEHSRVGGGEKQLTDVNKLADEYLRLAYHGLRAKDKHFNAELLTNFDEALPMVNTVQQDISRVLLNLFNNAFYAVNEKKKTAGNDYKPEVRVSTSSTAKEIVIKVKDNGNGIPDAIKDKIMQPFFYHETYGRGYRAGIVLKL